MPISVTTTRPNPNTERNAYDPPTSRNERSHHIDCRSEGGHFGSTSQTQQSRLPQRKRREKFQSHPNAERNRQLSRGGAAPWPRQAPYSLSARGLLPQGTPSPQRTPAPWQGVGSSAGVRNGVRRIFRVPQRASQCHRADSSCIQTSQREVVWKVSLMEKALSERGQDHTVDLNDFVNEAPIRPRRDSCHSLEVNGSLGSCDVFEASVISFVARRTDCSSKCHHHQLCHHHHHLARRLYPSCREGFCPDADKTACTHFRPEHDVKRLPLFSRFVVVSHGSQFCYGRRVCSRSRIPQNASQKKG